MTLDFRALCAELLLALEGEGYTHWTHSPDEDDLVLRARAALAEPKPPCRYIYNPAQIAECGGPCEQGPKHCDCGELWLAEPEPEGPIPSNEELALIYHDCCRGCEFMDQGGFEDAARAVLVRWGNPAPQPLADGEVAELVLRVQRLEAMRETEKAALLDAFKQIDDLKHRIDFHYTKIHRLKNALPLPEVDQMTWQSIDTAPRDGTEILASDYDAIEIVSWVGPGFDVKIIGEWTNREGEAMYPAWWQPLPDHLSLPGQEVDE